MKKVSNNGLQSSLSEKSLALNSISSEDIQANDIDELDMAIEPTIKKSSVNIKTAPLQKVRIIVCEIYCTKISFHDSINQTFQNYGEILISLCYEWDKITVKVIEAKNLPSMDLNGLAGS